MMLIFPDRKKKILVPAFFYFTKKIKRPNEDGDN